MHMRKGVVVALCMSAAFVAFVYLMNMLTPFQSDDYDYALIYGSAGENALPKRIVTIYDAFISVARQNYRPIPFFIGRVLCGCYEKCVFNVFNTAMMVVLVAMLYYVAVGARFVWTKFILMLTLVFLVLMRGESYLWGAGSVNYLWMGPLALLFLLMRRKMQVFALTLRSVVLYAPVMFLIGWSQDAFALPLAFAVGMMALFRFNNMRWTTWVLYGFFGLGVILLVYGSLGRASSSLSTTFSMYVLFMNLLKIAFCIKAVWLLLILVMLSKNRRTIFKNNVFEFLVILGAILMIARVGVFGERSLWCANLVAILLIVREFDVTPKFAGGLALFCVALMAAVVPYAHRISVEFERMEHIYLASNDGVTVHNKVDCGFLSRFCYQDIYKWQPGFHNQRFAEYHRRHGYVCALNRFMYENLYRQDRICMPENRLPISGDYYTTPECNAIISPVKDETDGRVHKEAVSVIYAYPKGFVSKMKREIGKRLGKQVPSPKIAINLRTAHGQYLLAPKEMFSDKYIKGVIWNSESQKE